MQATQYKVVEIFDSIEGEGKRAGKTATFVRLAGCNLRCSFCDTMYAVSTDCDYQIKTADEILKRAASFSRVTLTGGEPLLAAGVVELIKAFADSGVEVNIETNGSVDISEFLEIPNVFFTIDYKLPSSGVTGEMHLPNFDKLRPTDVLKLVVGNEKDLAHGLQFLSGLKSQPQIYIGEVYGSGMLQTIVDKMLTEPVVKNANLQLQFHKIVWDADERGV